jgi:hypothetical protein
VVLWLWQVADASKQVESDSMLINDRLASPATVENDSLAPRIGGICTGKKYCPHQAQPTFKSF